MLPQLYLQTAHVKRPSGLDRFGQVTLGAATAFACRYQPSNALVRNAVGDQVVASAVLYTAEPITTADTVFPPGSDTDDSNQGRNPLNVSTHYDLLSGAVSFYSVVL